MEGKFRSHLLQCLYRNGCMCLTYELFKLLENIFFLIEVPVTSWQWTKPTTQYSLLCTSEYYWKPIVLVAPFISQSCNHFCKPVFFKFLTSISDIQLVSSFCLPLLCSYVIWKLDNPLWRTMHPMEKTLWFFNIMQYFSQIPEHRFLILRILFFRNRLIYFLISVNAESTCPILQCILYMLTALHSFELLYTIIWFKQYIIVWIYTLKFSTVKDLIVAHRVALL